MKHLKSFLPIITIVLIAFFVRVVGLSVSPAGFNADEAALGYNAYSLIKTGHDEWGESWPIVFRSFGDYKPGLYVYLAIPFVFIGGLTEFTVRLPSIVLGVLSVLFIYLLSLELFRNKTVALSTALLLALSPWHIHFSRGAWETNVATFFLLTGIYTFIKGLKSYKYLYVSLLLFVLSLYTYQSTRVIVPLIGVGLILFFHKLFFQRKSIKLIAVAFLLLLPMIFVLLQGKGLSRFQGISIFTDRGIVDYANDVRGDHSNPDSIEAKFFHNKATTYGINFISRYLEHFDPNFIFISGDALKRNKVPEMGQLYIFEIITLLIGIFIAIRGGNNNVKIVALWLFVAPVAAALTYQTPHALRAHNMVIPLTIFSGLGLGAIIDYFVHKRFIVGRVMIIGFFILCSFFVLRFFEQYFIHLPKRYALEWQYGFNQLISYVYSNEQDYSRVVITDRYDQPYILYLFYTKYDPYLYQQQPKRFGDSQFGFLTVSGFGKYEFRAIGTNEPDVEQSVLFAGTEQEITPGAPHISQINYPNGDVAFKIAGKK